MDLNVTDEVFYQAFTIVGVAIALYYTLAVIHRGTRYRYFFYNAVLWSFILTSSICTGLSTLFLWPPLLKIAYFSAIITCLFFLLVSDTISREEIEPWKLFVYGIVATLGAIAILDPASVFRITLPNGLQTLNWDDFSNLMMGIIFLYPNIVYVYSVGRMHRQAPSSLKKYSGVYFIGVVLYGPVSGAILLFGLDLYLPGLNFIFAGVGVFLVAFVTARQPKLLFILPFRTIRLAVVDTKSGLPLFTHTWRQSGENLIDEDLFSGMLHGVSTIIKESLNRGNVTEIHLDKGILILQRSEQTSIACVLVTTKSSQTLRDALKLFGEKFYMQFKDKIATTINDAHQFAPASTLVTECFPFVPEYD